MDFISWFQGYYGCTPEAAEYLAQFAQDKAQRSGDSIPGHAQGLIAYVDMPEHIRRDPYVQPMDLATVTHVQAMTRRERIELEGGGAA